MDGVAGLFDSADVGGPEDEVRVDGFAAEGVDEEDDLAAVIPGVAVNLCEHLFERPAVCVAILPFPGEVPGELFIVQVVQERSPLGFDRRPEGMEVGEGHAFDYPIPLIPAGSDAVEPVAAGAEEMGHELESTLPGRIVSSVNGNRIEHLQNLDVAIPLVVIPRSKPFYEHAILARTSS